MNINPPPRPASPLLRVLLLVLLACLVLTASPASAWAQNDETASTSAKPQMAAALAYGLVIFVIALGLLILCRPANRKHVEGAPALGGLFSFGGSAAAPGQPLRKRPHRGVPVLVLSILGFTCCIFSLISYSMANTDLEAMQIGRMDRKGEGLTKAAKYISLVWIIWVLFVQVNWLIGFAIYVGVNY